MKKKLRKRIYRKVTTEERTRHQRIREQIVEELPDIKERGRDKLKEAAGRGIRIQHAMFALKAEREKQGLSLADMKQRTGIERSTLSRLENNQDANPTINTLARYANAVGKQILVVLADADDAGTEEQPRVASAG